MWWEWIYIEAVLKNYRLIEVPPNKELRKQLEGKSLEELTEILKSLKPQLHNDNRCGNRPPCNPGH